MRSWDRLPAFLADALKGVDMDGLYEIRLRTHQRIEICDAGGYRLLGSEVTPEQMSLAVAALTGHSVYACESQMREGFFTLPGGMRVGVAGRYDNCSGALQSISSISVRVPRDIDGDGDMVMKYLSRGLGISSCLILSPPGMGKTTLLRALIRRISQSGFHVAVADERDELSGGESMGSFVDTICNCPKRVSIPRIIRAMSPQVIVTDEIGHSTDGETIADAQRCGCAVVATAHARDMIAARKRATLSGMIDAGVFDLYVELARFPGHVARVLGKEGGVIWTDGA
ncbi:MAG: AAA family ATPase [Clostridia bacterium]|nr:AAA family ATPase [Clostridia bacterium]